MADLGAIGLGDVIQQTGAYYLITSGLGKISGTVKENDSDVIGKVMLYDEQARLIIDVAVGTTFAFIGISLNRKYTLFAQHIQDSNFNGLIFDRITPAALS